MAPVKFDGLVTTAVNITCVPDNVKNRVKEVVGITIVRSEQKLASLRQGSQMVYGTELTTIVEAEGTIDSNVGKSFLRLTMPHVLIRDSGKYTCNVHFVDEGGFLDMESVWDNLIVDEQDIQTHLAFLIRKVFTQGDTIKEQARQLEDQSRQLENKVDQLEHEFEKKRLATVERVVDLENTNNNQTKDIQDLIINGTYLSAFCASTKKEYPVKKGGVLVFGDVVTRKGKGYDENTGIFTAPYRGLYAFHLSLFARHSNQYVYVNIQAEDKVVAMVVTGDVDNWDQSSGSCVIFLEAGDHVKAVVNSIHTTNGYLLSYLKHDSLFSGYLVRAM